MGHQLPCHKSQVEQSCLVSSNTGLYDPASSVQSCRNPFSSASAVDLCSISELIIKKQDYIYSASTKISGPSPEGTQGLIIGCSDISQQGILVLPQLLDSNFTGEVKVLLQSFGLHVLSPETQPAKLLLLPLKGIFASSITSHPLAVAALYWTKRIEFQQPLLPVNLNGITNHGLLDTEADVSVIMQHEWPPQWEKSVGQSVITGVGEQICQCKVKILSNAQALRGKSLISNPLCYPFQSPSGVETF